MKKLSRGSQLLLKGALHPHQRLTPYKEWGFSRATFHEAVRVRNALVDRLYGIKRTNASRVVWQDLRPERRVAILRAAAGAEP